MLTMEVDSWQKDEIYLQKDKEWIKKTPPHNKEPRETKVKEESSQWVPYKK